MSQKNVEICRRVAELLGGDNPTASVHAVLEYVDPEIVFESAIVSRAEGGIYRGHDGLRAWAADYEAAFDEVRTTPEEFRDLDDRVLMLGRVVARGRGSGVPVESQTAFLSTLRDGRIVHAKGFLDWKQALEAAGPSE
jgi:ketosteroid isomerase-like protein